MHTLHQIATQADSKEEAHARVKDYLETALGEYDGPNNQWFDWFVVGGGRWSTSDDPYDTDYFPDVTHSSEPKFAENIAQAMTWREEELQRYAKQAREIKLIPLLSLLDKAGDNFNVGHQLYTLHKIYELTMGTWGYNSYFFDMLNDTTNDTYMKESLDKGDQTWYSVPVDFHY
jgi:hypothetical protein